MIEETFAIKYNSLDVNSLYTHFVNCHISIKDINLKQHVIKIRKFATTIELWEGKNLIGLCACYINNEVSKIAYITHIAIQPEYRHKGLGRFIIEKTKEEVIKRGFNKILLEVAKDNLYAIAFYTSLGFSIQEIRLNSFLMNKNL